MLLFALLSCSANTLVLRGEIAVFVVILIVAGGSSWILSFLIAIVLLQLVLQLCVHLRQQKHAEEEPEGENSRGELISLGGFVKLSIFYVQTNQSINSAVWHAFGYLVSWLDIISLDISGSRCLAFLDAVNDSETAKFLLFMAVPAILLVSIIAIVTVRILVQHLLWWLKLRKLQKAKPLLLLDEAAGEEEIVSFSDDDSVELTKPRVAWLRSAQSIGLFLLFVTYYDLAERSLSVFSSMPSKSGVVFMEELPWVPRSFADDEFRLLFICGVVFVVVYGLGVPLLFAVLLRYRKDHHHPAAFLWESYQPRFYWYEMVWIARRLVIAVVVSLIPEQGGLRAFFVVFTLMVFAVLLFHNRPFRHYKENMFDLLSTLTLLATFSCAEWGVAQTEAPGGLENLGIPASFYVALVANMTFVLALFFCTALPLLRAAASKLRGRCRGLAAR